MKILHGNFRIYGLVLITLIFLWGETLFSKSEFRATEYYVNKITLIGNRQFSTRKLKKQINLKRKTIWRTQTFTRRVLELDRLNLESFYVRQGYLYCTVKDSFVVHPNSRVDVFFIIKEGQPYILKEITISGAESLSQKKVLNLLGHKINEPYNPIQIRNGIKTIITEYANIGRPLTTITDSLEINHDIRLFLRIRESKPIYVNRVIITNNKLVKEKPIRREVEFQSGDRYSLKKIDLSKRHIYETGLFSSVNIRLADVDTAQSKVNLIVEVRELDMRYLGLNFGFGQDRGVNEGKEAYTSVEVTGEWLNRNITGIGRRLSLKSESALNINATGLSQPRMYGAITWVEPWMLGFRSSNSFSIYAEKQWSEIDSNFYETNYGSEVALIYQPERRLYLKTGLAPKKIISRLQTGKSENTEMAITLDFRRDHRDNFIFPKRGTYFTVSGKIGLVSGGTANYYKLEPSYSRYFNIFGPVVLACRGKFGIMNPLKVGRPTPQYEKFYLGGTTSLRGWLDNKFITDDGLRNGVAIGDDFKILTSAEIRFPLFWLLGGEIFIDGGNLVSDVKDLFDRRYRWNYGIGLTLATPLGPIRIDYAWKINQIGKESKGEIQLGIPYAF